MRRTVATPFNLPFPHPEVGPTTIWLKNRRRYMSSLKPVCLHDPLRPPGWVKGQLEPAAAPSRASEASPLRMNVADDDDNNAIDEFRWRRVLQGELHSERGCG